MPIKYLRYVFSFGTESPVVISGGDVAVRRPLNGERQYYSRIYPLNKHLEFANSRYNNAPRKYSELGNRLNMSYKRVISPFSLLSLSHSCSRSLVRSLARSRLVFIYAIMQRGTGWWLFEGRRGVPFLKLISGDYVLNGKLIRGLHSSPGLWELSRETILESNDQPCDSFARISEFNYGT